MRKIKILIIIILGVFAALTACWYIFATPAFILKLGNDALNKYNYSLTAENFNHIVPFNIKGDKLSLMQGKKALAYAQDVRISLNPLFLSIDFKAKLCGGDLRGSYSLFKGLAFKLKDSNLSNFKGSMEGFLNASFEENKFNFQTNKARFEDWSGIPLSIFNNAQGSLFIDPDKANLISISLTGEAGNATLKGSITKKRIDLTLEFIPNESSTLWQEKFEGYHMKDGRFVIAVSLPTIIFMH